LEEDETRPDAEVKEDELSREEKEEVLSILIFF